MEIIGNRLFVATLDGIKFIDTDNLNTTVTWSTGEVGNKIIVNPIATSPGTTTSYSATVSYGSITGSDQVTFTLPTKPTISASGPTTFCAGGSVTLTANSSPAGVYSYTWQTGAITQGINAASSGSYTVTAVNSNGCSETSIPTIITVNPLPSAPVANSISLQYNGLLQSTDLIPISGQSISWFNALTGGVSSTKPQGINVGTYNSYANAIIDATGCTSLTRTPVLFTITTAPLSITGITGANKVYDGTTIATINGTASYVGLVAADAGLAITGAPSFNFNNKNVGTAKPITVAGFTAPTSNYSLTQPTGLTGSITPKTVNVIATANDKQYDGNTTATLSNITSPGFISGDLVTINYASATFDTKEVGNNKTVTVNGINLTSTDAPNYLLASNTATALANITAPPVFIFEVPNAFTPNGDGLNDLLKIISNAGIIELRSFKVFSRSGNLVFESRDLSRGWDGRFNGNLLQADIYYWTAVYVDRNNVVNSKNGTVLLLK